MPHTRIYDVGLEANAANYVALTPLSFAERTAAIYPEYLAIVHGARRITWGETFSRMRRQASALQQLGIGTGDTVSIIAANIPEMFEAHFGVPMAGAVLNTINTRLDAEAIAFILSHAETKALFVDPEFSEVTERAIKIAGNFGINLEVTAEVGKLLGIDDYLPVTNTRRLFWSMNFMAGFEF